MTTLASGKFLRLVRKGNWEYVERRRASGVVAIVAVTPDAELLLTEQYRPAVNRNVIDLPAGLAGDERGSEQESLASAARRELTEETGYAARRLKQLFTGPPSAGISSELVTFFRAADIRPAGAGGGVRSERIAVHRVPLSDVDRWLQRAGRRAYIDPKVYAGLYFALQSEVARGDQ